MQAKFVPKDVRKRLETAIQEVLFEILGKATEKIKFAKSFQLPATLPKVDPDKFYHGLIEHKGWQIKLNSQLKEFEKRVSKRARELQNMKPAITQEHAQQLADLCDKP